MSVIEVTREHLVNALREEGLRVDRLYHQRRPDPRWNQRWVAVFEPPLDFAPSEYERRIIAAVRRHLRALVSNVIVDELLGDWDFNPYVRSGGTRPAERKITVQVTFVVTPSSMTRGDMW